MKNRFLFLFVFTALVGCSSSPSADDEPAADEGAVAEDGAAVDEGLSDEPMSGGEESVATDESAPPTEKSLYDRLGGKGKLQQFADKFVTALAGNPELQKNPSIAAALKADQTKHKQMLVDFFCANSGGPCSYAGKPIKETHAPLKVSKADWNIMRKVFIRTLRQMKVPKKERMDLALIAARQKKHIVSQ